jgi:hypothetical protein
MSEPHALRRPEGVKVIASTEDGSGEDAIAQRAERG